MQNIGYISGNTNFYDIPKKVVDYTSSSIAFAFSKIKEANNYVESCSYPAKFVIRFSLGAGLTCALMPIRLITLLLTDLSLKIAIGTDKYALMQEESRLYDGEEDLSFYGLTIACVVTPIIEEIAFRWVLYYLIKKPIQFTASFFYEESMANKIGAFAAIIISSGVFGLIHFVNSTNPIVALPQVIHATIMGIVLGCEKEFGGGIVMSIGDHMMNNILASLESLALSK